MEKIKLVARSCTLSLLLLAFNSRSVVQNTQLNKSNIQAPTLPRSNVQKTNVQSAKLQSTNHQYTKFQQTNSSAIIGKKSVNKLSFLTGLPKPPYILEDGQTGLQLDLIQLAFTCENNSENHGKVDFINMPLGRNISRLKSSYADGMITLPNDFSYPGIYLSTPYISYQNVAVSLADNHLTINKFDDLTLMSVAAF
ncbi:MAG: hypothetical protein ACSHW0_18200 [Thalassotalea sp.]